MCMVYRFLWGILHFGYFLYSNNETNWKQLWKGGGDGLGGGKTGMWMEACAERKQVLNFKDI